MASTLQSLAITCMPDLLTPLHSGRSTQMRIPLHHVQMEGCLHLTSLIESAVAGTLRRVTAHGCSTCCEHADLEQGPALPCQRTVDRAAHGNLLP